MRRTEHVASGPMGRMERQRVVQTTAAGRAAGVALAVECGTADVIAASEQIVASAVRRRTPARTAVLSLAEQVVALDARRVELGCSRSALARLLGVSPATITRALAPLRAAAPSRSKLHSADGLRRIEVALALYARERDARSATTPRQASKAARAAQTPRNQRAITNDEVIAPRSRTQARTVKIAKWLETEQPVDLPDVAPSKVASGMQHRETFRILVAEDDPATISLYQMVLAEEEDISYDLEFVQTPQDCLERLVRAARGMPYDLLLTDLGLADIRPDDQRPSLLQQFTQHPELLPRATLVVSGISPYALQRKRAQLVALHAAFLPKPFDIDELLAVVRALCLVEMLPEACVSFDESAWQ